jgi:hypothetical protein
LVGGIPMQNRLRLAALLALALVFPLRALSAQEVLRTDRLPVGFAVTAVSDGGRYLTLQDGRVWEVEISDRATTGSWGAGDFVALRRISAPRGDYAWLFVRRGDLDQQAAARLVGRRPPSAGTQ